MSRLDVTDWAELLGEMTAGKRIAGAVYVHVSALSDHARDLVQRACELAAVPFDRVTVAKFATDAPGLSLLDYPRFREDGFPTLQASWTIDLDAGTANLRDYSDRDNPPVLHRKEQMLRPDDPDVPQFARLTAQSESAGLFADTAIIGHAAAWEEELVARGLAVVDHELVAQAAGPDVRDWQAQRHRTALSRTGLSSPVHALWRHGFLGDGTTFFDYGCGRGDDVALLADRGIAAQGWDPWFRNDAARKVADAVNIGFVLNVVEDVRERREALKGAWQLCTKVLSVAALIGGRTAQDRWRLYQDGVLTSRGTFQKYFTHPELGEYISETLGRDPVAVQPGVYLVFRRDEDEQDFLERRQRTRFSWHAAAPTKNRLPKAPRPPRESRDRSLRQPGVDRWTLFEDLAERFWAKCLSLGRVPDLLEWPELADLETNLAKPERVLARLLQSHDPDELEAARMHRMDDLRVFLALQLFERRKSYGQLSLRLQRDVRVFWGSLAKAVDDAKALLFSTGNQDGITAACLQTFQDGLGWLETRVDGSPDSLHLVADRLGELPPLLRVYVGCATRLYGDLEAADVVKVHARSPKVTALTYDDFEGKDEPLLMERVKIDLRRAEIDVFGYGTEKYPAEPLLAKGRLYGQVDWPTSTEPQ